VYTCVHVCVYLQTHIYIAAGSAAVSNRCSALTSCDEQRIMRVFVCVCISMCVYIYIYICLYIYMNCCMYLYIYIYEQ